ncbi:M1 family aminopeptidase [Nocardioides pantholopis]|uniref:M1 family aminopeptidase n=1 Tax=Nocardioides pantholopis TaxID=2483798 RepID=UPI0013DE6FE6|nr:M1 family aminopeptidase [Nocardioides pantholopis]
MTLTRTAGHSRWRRTAARAVPIVLMASGLGATAAPSYADPVAPVDGPQTAGDAIFPHVGNGGYDALHYDVDIAWNATGVVGSMMTGNFGSASTTMVAATTGAPLRSFSLDFEGLEIDSVTVDGQPATFERVQDNAAIKFKLIITPATPVEGEFTTVVKYHGNPKVHVDPDDSWEGWAPTTDGAIFMGQPVGSMAGYPNNNTPGDKATYTFSLDIPSTLTSATGTGPAAAVSNGELVSRTPSVNGRRTTWEWVQEKQMASELALISIGRYDVMESQVTLASGRVIPEWSFMDAALSDANKTTIRNRRTQIGPIINRLESIFGPYPGNSTGVVIDTVPSGINYALETQDRSFFPSAGSVNGNTLIHELAHQWYGDNVSPGLWTDIWINEGMGTWAPTWHNSVLAPATPNPAAVETTYYNSWNGTAPTSANWRTPPGAQTDPSDLYGYQTYTRGAQFWEALRTVLRDRDFFAVMKEWQTTYAGQSPRGDRLKDLAEEISGHDLDAFWQDWIYDADKPAWPAKYDVSLTSTPGQGTQASGTAMTYTLSAANTGRVALTDGVVTVDITALTDDATLGTLPAGVTRSGNTLTWTVPTTATGTTATVEIPVTITGSATSPRETIFATADAASLGGACAVCGALETAPRPVVAGTPAVGAPLTADTTDWPAGTTVAAYQWAVGGLPVAGATEATYIPTAADVRKIVTVAVTGTAPGFAPTRRISIPTAGVVPGTQTGTPTPSLSATPQVGVQVSAVTGDWDAGTTLSYQWKVAGADVGMESSYTPVVADAGRALTVAVTGTRDGYAQVTRTSVAVDVAPGAPVLTPAPVLDGAPVVGAPVTVAPGTWDAGTTLSYRWALDGNGLEGVGGTSFTPRAVDLGKTLVVTVTGTRTGYATVSRASEPVVIAGGTLETAPMPTIDGTPAVGTVLTAVPGPWDDGVTLSYRWLVGDVEVGVGATYTPTAADLGKPVAVAVTGSKPGYDAVTLMAETPGVAAGTLAATPVPTVSGAARFGSTLAAATGRWDDGVTPAYQWLRNGRPIAGATAASYRLGISDLGARITVAVTGTKAGYTAVTRTSAATATVARATLGSGTVKVSGKARVGKVLKARATGFGNGVKVNYAWYAGSKRIGSKATVKLGRSTAGKKVTVKVTVTKVGHVTATVTSRATAKVKRK